MNEKNDMEQDAQSRNTHYLVLAAAAMMSSVLLAACELGGGGGSGGSGGSTIRGSLRSFQGGQAMYMPDRSPNLFTRAMKTIADAVITPVMAAVPGVTVSVAGTDLATTTASDGLFVVSGVPAGTREVVFSMGPDSGSLSLDVPGNAIIDLGDVDVRNGKASPSKIEIEIFEDGNANGGANGNENSSSGSENGNENSGSNSGSGSNGNENGSSGSGNGNENGP